jgi:hypothetical protein
MEEEGADPEVRRKPIELSGTLEVVTVFLIVQEGCSTNELR